MCQKHREPKCHQGHSLDAMSTIQYKDNSSRNPVGYVYLTGDRSGSETSTCSTHTLDDDSESPKPTGDATDLSGLVDQADRSSIQVRTGPTEDGSTISSFFIRRRRDQLLSRIEQQIKQGRQAEKSKVFLMRRSKQSKEEASSIIAHRRAWSLLKPMTSRKPSGDDD